MDAAGKKRLAFSLPAWLALGVGRLSEAWARTTKGIPMVPLEGVRLMLEDFRPSTPPTARDATA